MAVDSIAIAPDPKRDAAARKLLPLVKTWSIVTLRQAYGSFPAGTVFRTAPASKPFLRDGRLVTHYLVNTVACDCPDYEQWQHVCKHIRAYTLFRRQNAEATATAQTTYHEQLRQREKVLRLLGWQKDEYMDDPRYAKLQEWVERADARTGG